MKFIPAYPTAHYWKHLPDGNRIWKQGSPGMSLRQNYKIRLGCAIVQGIGNKILELLEDDDFEGLFAEFFGRIAKASATGADQFLEDDGIFNYEENFGNTDEYHEHNHNNHRNNHNNHRNDYHGNHNGRRNYSNQQSYSGHHNRY